MTKVTVAEKRACIKVRGICGRHVRGRPLHEALSKLVEQWDMAEAQATLEVIGTPRPLTPQAELTLYRAAQEALTNVGKHAQASRVRLTLDYRDAASVHLRVEDDGAGGGSLEQGFGLLGIRERAQLLGGEARVSTKAGEGFCLEVELPA